MNSERIAFGIITQSLDKLSPITDFLDNAQKYGHKITDLIICYKDSVDENIVKELQKRCQVIIVRRGHSQYLYDSLLNLGLNEEEIDAIIGTPYMDKYRKVAYGTSRNYLLLTAIFNNIDYLLFFDSDTYPKVLSEDEKGNYIFKDIDFVGNHLKFLRGHNDIVATTSDYTGYYIIPKMSFPYLMELLRGIQKEDRFYYITAVDTPVTANNCLTNIFNTNKILGGNVAINLDKFDLLPPFYSSTMVVDDECYLGRGEDTLFGPIIHHFGGRCVDIDMLIFHNCFGDFPHKPEISKQKNVDRFFYACMGWIIRNPFFNWTRSHYFDEYEEINIEKRYHELVKGSQAAAEHFQDERFLLLPRAYKMAYEQLPSDIERFNKLQNAWNKMKANLTEINKVSSL